MIFTAPTAFQTALDHSAVKTLLPSSLDSRQAQDELGVEIRERARFSSEIVNAEILDELDHWVDELTQGNTDLATARNALRAKADELGYEPAPGTEGTIKDFLSSPRLNVALRTNVQMAQGYGQFIQGQDPAVLDLYPAQELYRAAARKVPRNWNARFHAAANATNTPVAGFVALKNAPIWPALSRFGNPYPPFDYNSGMDVRNVIRSAAMAAGLIDRDTRLTPEDRGFNDDLRFTPRIRSEQLRQAIIDGSDGRLEFDSSGVLHLKTVAANEAQAIVDRYDPADRATWAPGDDEDQAFARYLLALFHADAPALQEAA